jgi:hypothetical protein
MRAARYALLLSVFTLGGCFRQIAVNSMAGIMDDGYDVLNEESDLALAEASIASNLKLIESVLRSDSGNTDLLLLACRGYAGYALGFVEDEDPARAREFYRRARDFGLRILTTDRSLRDGLAAGPDSLAAVLKSAGAKDVPALYWTGIAWGSWIALGLNDPAGLADLPKVEAIMEHVASADPAYYYGGADLFLGTIKGTKPAMLGGNPGASRAHFEKAIDASGGRFLLTYIFYARSYAVQTQDRELFESCLTAVDTASIDMLPEARLTNAIAKRKSALLRSRIDELF